MLYWKNFQDIDKLSKCLSGGGLALCSSDTVLGLFAQLSEITKKKIDTTKSRFDKPYLVLAASLDDIIEYLDQDFLMTYQQLCNSYWPGPITFIMKASKGCPKWVKSAQNSIGVRIPDHKGLQLLLQDVGPLFSTSANVSGMPVPSQLEEVDQQILKNVDCVCVESVDKQPVVASTVVDLTGEKPAVLRQGKVSFLHI